MLTRRQMLLGSAASLAAVAAPVAGRRTQPAAVAAPALPPPAASGIDHVVVVMMENRSFDHLLGWLPGADGRQSGLTYTDRNGIPHATHHLTDFQGCAHPDPDHSFAGGRVEYDGGRCDGWLRAGSNDDFSIGYYTASDLAFLGRAARDWTICDRYFAAIMAETYPNRIYQHAAQTDRITNTTDLSTLATIWDRLADAGVSRAYYFSDVPFTALWGTRYVSISRPFAQFLADAQTGRLPAVSFVDPRFLDEASGTSGDDHPHGDLRAGESFLAQVYDAVVSGPLWPRTLLVVNFDEWGGFFDHVAPRWAPDAHPAWGLRGFRVPCLVVSPLARRGYVAHGTYDHTSLLKLIEWRWSLPSLTPRDASARNLAAVLAFGTPRLRAPFYVVPPFTGMACAVQGAEDQEWAALADLARAEGFPVPV